MKYLACKFPNSTRSYTYSAPDDLEVSVGDLVQVATKTGARTVEVTELPQAAPYGIQIKEILGKAPIGENQ